MEQINFGQQGWICPKCGRVLAPSTMYCLWCCSDMKETITTTPSTIPKTTLDIMPIKGCGIAEQPEPKVSFIKEISTTAKGYSKTVTEPQNGYCNECKWYGDKQVCGRCRSRNLYAPKDEPQTERSE